MFEVLGPLHHFELLHRFHSILHIAGGKGRTSEEEATAQVFQGFLRFFGGGFARGVGQIVVRAENVLG